MLNIIKEMKNKAIMKSNTYPPGWPKLKRMMLPSLEEELICSYWECKMIHYFRKDWEVSHKIKHAIKRKNSISRYLPKRN